MGQGLVTKVVQTVASTLSQALEEGAPPFPVALIRTTDPSTLAVPFFSVTGGSTTSEGACEAVRAACGQLVERLAPLARSKREAGGKVLTWQQLAAAAHAGQMPFNGMTPPMTMTAYAEAQLGEGGGYTTYGAAVVVAEVDALTGDRQVRRRRGLGGGGGSQVVSGRGERWKADDWREAREEGGRGRECC